MHTRTVRRAFMYVCRCPRHVCIVYLHVGVDTHTECLEGRVEREEMLRAVRQVRQHG